jgi:hypothetical protein
VPGLVVDFGHQVKVRPVAKIGKLAGQQTFVGSRFQTLEVLEDVPAPGVQTGIGRRLRRATAGHQHRGEQNAADAFHTWFPQMSSRFMPSSVEDVNVPLDYAEAKQKWREL